MAAQGTADSDSAARSESSTSTPTKSEHPWHKICSAAAAKVPFVLNPRPEPGLLKWPWVGVIRVLAHDIQDATVPIKWPRGPSWWLYRTIPRHVLTIAADFSETYVTRAGVLLGVFKHRRVVLRPITELGWGMESIAGTRDRERMNAVVARNVQAIRDVPRHPNVEHVIGVCGCAEASMYTVSPFLESVPLLQHIESSPTVRTKIQALGPISGCARRSLTRGVQLLDVARALAHLHAHGMVHGEVRADNVIVNSSGSCILSGWARRAVWDDYTDAKVFFHSTLFDIDFPYSGLIWPSNPEESPRRFTEPDTVWPRTAHKLVRRLRSNTEAAFAFAFAFLIIEVFECVRTEDNQALLKLLRSAAPKPDSGKSADSSFDMSQVILNTRINGIPDALWDICLGCWSAAESRPKMQIFPALLELSMKEVSAPNCT